MKKNQNAIIAVNGPTGSGKSFASLREAWELAQMTQTNFSIEDNLAFSFSSLLKKTMLPQNQKPGTVYVFEEVGAIGSGADSMEWASKANKFFSSFLQTVRSKRQILFFNCPQFANLSSTARKLCHMQWSMNGIDYVRKVSFVKPYQIQINDRTGQSYFKWVRCKQNGVKIKINRMEVEMPPKNLIKEYETAKKIFQETHYKKMEEELDAAEKKEEIIPDITCGYCGHSWQPRKSKPVRCPRCQRVLVPPKRISDIHQEVVLEALKNDSSIDNPILFYQKPHNQLNLAGDNIQRNPNKDIVPNS